MDGGRNGGGKGAGLGCFLFSRLIDSQMSGGVGVFAASGAAAPLRHFSLPQINTSPHGRREQRRAAKQRLCHGERKQT